MATTEPPPPTRRAEGTLGAGGVAVPPTHRDLAVGGLSPTRRADEAAGHVFPATRRHQGAGGAGEGRPAELPPEVASGHSVHRWLPLSASGEASALAELDGGRLLLKLYREGARVDGRVRDDWGQLRHRAVVRLRAHGVDQNRRWELMDRVPGENLRRVLQASPDGLGPEAVRAIVQRLASALERLGKRRITHGDLRPENLVVSPDRPHAVVLVDFGVALHLEQELVYKQLGSSLAYAAPEVLAHGATAASDWWSLGIVMAELLTGRHPGGRAPESIAQEAVSGERLADPGLPEEFLPLWEGLTRPGYADRWQASEVGAWLKGGAVPRRARRARTGPEPEAVPRVAVADDPFVFVDQQHFTRAALADSIRANWDAAERQFFGTGREADAWGQLSAWLRQFPPERGARSGPDIVGHVEAAAAGPDPWSPSALLVRLLHDLDPWSPPRYQRHVIGPERLRLVIGLAIGSDVEGAPPAGLGLWGAPDEAARFFDDFWRWPLLAEVDGTRETGDFTELDARWRELHQLWERWVTELAVTNAPAHEAIQGWPGSVPVRAHLLLLALGGRHAVYLADEVTAARAAVRAARGGIPLDWFEAVAAIPGEVGALLGFAASATARAEAASDADERRLLLQDAATRSLLRDGNEFWRAFNRPVAVGWAGAGLAVTVALWVVSLVAVDVIPAASGAAVVRAWTVTAVAVVLQVGAEAWVSLSIGGAYHPTYSLFSVLVRSGGAVVRFFGTAWRGSIVVTVLLALAVVAAAGVLLVAPYVPAAVIPLLHLGSAVRRYRLWCTDHDQQDDGGEPGVQADRTGTGPPDAGIPSYPGPPSNPGTPSAAGIPSAVA